jgi:type I restriction enzyme S subunit
LNVDEPRLEPIGRYVLPISNWNPRKDCQAASFRYVDLSSVDQDTKTIAANGEMPTSDAPSRARQLLRAGDVIVSTVRPNLNGVASVPADLDGATGSTGFCVLRADPDRLDPRYLLHWVRTPQFVSDMTKKATGQSYPAVSDRIVKESLIPLPTVEKQKRIAAVLDQADELSWLRQKSVERLRDLGQSLFDEMFGEPRRNPRGFERVKLGEIVDFVGGSQPPKSNFLYEDGPERVRFVQIRDFRTDAYKTYVPKALAKRPFSEDDVMIGRYGPPVFQIFRGLAGTYNVALMKADPREGVTKDFIFYLLQERALHSYVVANSERTAGQSGVNLELLNNYQVYRPPLALQKDFSKRLAQFETVASSARLSSQQYGVLFTSLRQRAFAGEL